LYRTTDGGAHWTEQDIGFGLNPSRTGGNGLQDIQFVDSRGGWIAGDHGLLMQTTDGGSQWREVGSGVSVPLQGLHFVNSQRGWIAGDYGTILSYAGDRIPAGRPAVFSVVNGASFLPGIASGAWITIKGANLSQSSRLWTGADFIGDLLPVQLDGVRVNVNGRPAYPYYISPAQINVLTGADGTEGSVAVEVVTSQGKSEAFMAQKAKYSPALFSYSARGGKYAITHTPDGAWIGGYMLASALGLSGKMRDSKPGEIVTLYGTGFGETNPATSPDSLVAQPAQLAAPVSFRFGRATAEVQWAGLVGPGLYQFNIRIPNVVGGDHVVVAEIGGFRSQGDAVIPVEARR
jgi:uncharacterized protein (TIGR03437 family)